MTKNEITFSHFSNGVDTKNSVRTYLGNLGMFEFLDDVEAELKIVNGKIEFEILDKQFYTPEDIKDIMGVLKQIDWDNGYEYIQLFDNGDGTEYSLCGDRSSEMADIMNSTQNQRNLYNFRKKTIGI